MSHLTVRSLGTEGRKENPAEEVPASDTVYECVRLAVTGRENVTNLQSDARSFIVFRASDVKDLQIEAPTANDSAPQDPAIVGVRLSTTLAMRA